MAFDGELRECLAEILGAPAPEPDGDALLFYKQWLAERNLGLVPIAEPASFSWAGQWLARISGHAVVMFGSPSGAWLDPAGAYGGTIEEGWLVAPLDLHLSTTSPYGTAARAGVVEALLVAPDAEGPLHRVDSVEAIAGRGLEGDRYAAGRGTFSGGVGYELTLIQAEVLDEIDLSPEDARRNIVTRGIDLNALAGRRFRIGDVECIGRRLAEPCSHLDRLVGRPLLRPLVHKGGLRADIVTGGQIGVGDAVSP